jgi:hypothetical protein
VVPLEDVAVVELYFAFYEGKLSIHESINALEYSGVPDFII